MESRLIYEFNKTYLHKVVWENFQSESEWHFIGNENINEGEIQTLINENFFEDNLYIVLNRSDSQEICKVEASKKIMTVIRDTNFTIWNEKFQKVIEFNKNGIYRVGTILMT